MGCRVHTCCCGCTLRTGCISFGSTYLVYGVILFLFNIFATVWASNTDELTTTRIVMIVVQVIFILCCALLITGASMNKWCLCCFWIIGYLAYFLTDLIVMSLLYHFGWDEMKYYNVDQNNYSEDFAEVLVKVALALDILSRIISLSIGIYCIIVVRSFVEELKHPENVSENQSYQPNEPYQQNQPYQQSYPRQHNYPPPAYSYEQNPPSQ